MASEDGNANITTEDGAASNSPPVPAAHPKPSVRLDSYQTESDFVVSVMVKNLKKEDVAVVFESEMVKITAKLPDGSDYSKDVHCARKINPENCSFKVLGTKVEIRLRKLEAGIWPALEAEKADNVKDFKPSYPSSSTKGKDWDKVDRDIAKQLEAEPDEDINNLFAKIFKSGDDNTRRAMMKSMQESNGTVLSTNWEEVGSKKVEVSPPDGMEYKKWDKN